MSDSRPTKLPRLITWVAIGVALLAHPTFSSAAADDGIAFFEKRVRPVLVEQCYKCHSAEARTAGKLKGELLLDTNDGLLKGGENGPAIVPGEPEKSKFIEAVRYTNPDLQMPPKGKRLTAQQVADLVAWVKMGAPDPRTAAAAPATATASPYDFAAARKQWAFTRPIEPRVPDVKGADWARSPIDRFVLAKLEEKGLRPARPADKRTLVRRATFDLTGLPPTSEEVDAFVADESPDAFAKAVDRLLASPAYGERWGRHWLDVVRYTDSFDARGIGGDADVPAAWRYRDWVVDAFNRDLPYDRFVAQQIAGDLLPPSGARGAASKDGLIATGVYVIGEWGGGDADKEKMLTDIVDDQVDVTGRAFLGLTVACARCHDHKFDPIPQADYYSLAGIFFSSHILPGPGAKTAGSPVLRIPLADPSEVAERKQILARITGLNQQIEETIARQYAARAEEVLRRSDEYLGAAWEYARPPADRQSQTAAQLAAERKLDAYALGRWVALVENRPAAVKLLAEPVRDVGGIKGLSGWRNPGPSGTPAASANATDQPVTVTTLTLPPHSVAIHPSPTSAVAVGWRSPVTGRFAIRGAVSDADPNCGDGITWRVSVRALNGVRQLLAGSIANGGRQSFSEAAGAADRLGRVEVREGEVVEVTVGPKGEYSCDTTVVDFHITEADGERREWDLSREVSQSVLADGKSNPHADAFGHPGVWSFYETPIAPEPPAAPPGSALARWLDLARAATADREQVATAAAEVSRAFNSMTDGRPEAATAPDREAYKALSDPMGPFWSDARRDDKNLPGPAREQVVKLRAEVQSLQKKAAEAVPYAHALQEGGTPQSAYEGFHDARVLARGRYDRPGEVVPRRFPRVLAGDEQPAIAEGSGRRELARWVASADNPLTARVMANRIWQHHFGQGIVRTPNNFGKLGTPPTHPELLDWLAVQFVKDGWSIKAMHRRMMLSAAYQQASVPDAATLRADPDNLLLGRMPRQRLEAEAIRDSLLAVAGRLDATRGGPAFEDLAIPRRTIYLRTVRSDRSSYRMLFDAADPQIIVDQRTHSTVAPQALFLMNDPFAAAQAKALAALAQRQAGEDRDRINWLYKRLFARSPKERESEIGLQALSHVRDLESTELAWQQYCQVLLCSNEFVYVE